MDEQRLAEVICRAEHLCRERGARLTPLRRSVLALLCGSDRPLSAYEILDRMGSNTRPPAPPTVYRALDFLLAQGLAHKLESLHAFVGCAHPEHPHASQFLICADCGQVREVESQAVAQSLQAAAEAKGFRTRRPVVELVGTCARCARSDRAEPESRENKP